MEFVCYLLFVLQIKCAEAHIYYSQNSTGTHIEATNFCSSMNGSLLRYGELFNKVVELCGHIGVAVWTGLPFYERLPECYFEVRTTGAAVFLNMSAENRTPNKHVAICADFCGGNIYKNFSVNIDDCRCYGDYNQSPIPSYHLKCPNKYGLQCPGNEHDRCGKNENQSIVYQKIQSYLPDQRCQYRKYITTTSYGKNMEVNCAPQSLSYICRVGNSDDIFCGFEKPLPVQPTRETQLCGTSISVYAGFGISIAVLICIVIILTAVVICLQRRVKMLEKHQSMYESLQPAHTPVVLPLYDDIQQFSEKSAEH